MAGTLDYMMFESIDEPVWLPRPGAEGAARCDPCAWRGRAALCDTLKLKCHIATCMCTALRMVHDREFQLVNLCVQVRGMFNPLSIANELVCNTEIHS